MDARHGRGWSTSGQSPCNKPSHADDVKCFIHGPCNTSETASGADLLDEVELLRRWGAPVFDLDGGEDCELLSDVLGADGDGGETDEVRTAFAEAIADEAALLVLECSGVVAEEARCATANSKANSVLNRQLIRTASAAALVR